MKRKADDDPSSHAHITLIKTEKIDSSTDYSQDVKKKINASARTGQACDRCRVSVPLSLLLLQSLHSSHIGLGSKDALR